MTRNNGEKASLTPSVMASLVNRRIECQAHFLTSAIPTGSVPAQPVRGGRYLGHAFCSFTVLLNLRSTIL